MRTVVFRPDPFDLALVHSGSLDERELAHVIADRRDALAVRHSSLRHQVEAADAWLTEAERAAMAHALARLSAELSWHEELLDRLPKIVADFQERRRTTPG